MGAITEAWNDPRGKMGMTAAGLGLGAGSLGLLASFNGAFGSDPSMSAGLGLGASIAGFGAGTAGLLNTIRMNKMKKNMLRAQGADNSYEKGMRHWGLAESIGGLGGGAAGLIGSALTMSGHKKTGGVFTAIGGALNGIKALSGLTKSFVTRHHDKKESEKKLIGENADEQIRNRAILNKYRGKGDDKGKTDAEILERHQGEQLRKRDLRRARKELRKETMNQDASQDAALKARQVAYKQEGHSRRKAFSTGFGTNVFGLLSAATTMTNGINGYNGVMEGAGADFAKWGGLVGAIGGVAGGAIGMAGAAEGRSKLKSKPKLRTRYGNMPAGDNANAGGNAGPAAANAGSDAANVGQVDDHGRNDGAGNGANNGGINLANMDNDRLAQLMAQIRTEQERRKNQLLGNNDDDQDDGDDLDIPEQMDILGDRPGGHGGDDAVQNAINAAADIEEGGNPQRRVNNGNGEGSADGLPGGDAAERARLMEQINEMTQGGMPRELQELVDGKGKDDADEALLEGIDFSKAVKGK